MALWCTAVYLVEYKVQDSARNKRQYYFKCVDSRDYKGIKVYSLDDLYKIGSELLNKESSNICISYTNLIITGHEIHRYGLERINENIRMYKSYRLNNYRLLSGENEYYIDSVLYTPDSIVLINKVMFDQVVDAEAKKVIKDIHDVRKERVFNEYIYIFPYLEPKYKKTYVPNKRRVAIGQTDDELVCLSEDCNISIVNKSEYLDACRFSSVNGEVEKDVYGITNLTGSDVSWKQSWKYNGIPEIKQYLPIVSKDILTDKVKVASDQIRNKIELAAVAGSGWYMDSNGVIRVTEDSRPISIRVDKFIYSELRVVSTADKYKIKPGKKYNEEIINVQDIICADGPKTLVQCLITGEGVIKLPSTLTSIQGAGLKLEYAKRVDLRYLTKLTTVQADLEFTNATEVYLPDSIRSIRRGKLIFPCIKDFILPNNLQWIPFGSFQIEKLTRLVLPRHKISGYSGIDDISIISVDNFVNWSDNLREIWATLENWKIAKEIAIRINQKRVVNGKKQIDIRVVLIKEKEGTEPWHFGV